MTWPLRKLRTREHVIADLGLNHLERYILLCGHTPQQIQHDYGYDAFMTTNNSIEGHSPMSKPAISFGDLRRLLLDLAFAEVVVPKSHMGFRHNDSETEIFLPTYRPNQRVAPRHLAVVRTMLDAKGLLDGAEFDRLLADVAARLSVSR